MLIRRVEILDTCVFFGYPILFILSLSAKTKQHQKASFFHRMSNGKNNTATKIRVKGEKRKQDWMKVQKL
jgi:hypothetical protein